MLVQRTGEIKSEIVLIHATVYTIWRLSDPEFFQIVQDFNFIITLL